MIRVRRIAHATFETIDLQRLTAYYTDILGLTLVERDARTAYLASTIDHHSVVLKQGEASRCTRLAFQLAPGTDLAEFARQLSGFDIASEHRRDPQPSITELLAFKDPKGTEIEVFVESTPAPQRYRESGIVPRKLGHVAFNVTDMPAIVQFYTKVLGFRESDWMGDFFVFMRCNPDHHTVNFVTGKADKMHHIAFELKDWAHIQAACDILGRHKIPLIWGPGRHGMGHNIFTYHYDPDGHKIELFTELDRMTDEDLGYFEPRPSHEDIPQRPKVWPPGSSAANLWGVAPPSDFLE